MQMGLFPQGMGVRSRERIPLRGVDPSPLDRCHGKSLASRSGFALLASWRQGGGGRSTKREPVSARGVLPNARRGVFSTSHPSRGSWAGGCLVAAPSTVLTSACPPTDRSQEPPEGATLGSVPAKPRSAEAGTGQPGRSNIGGAGPRTLCPRVMRISGRLIAGCRDTKPPGGCLRGRYRDTTTPLRDQDAS